MDHHRRIAHPDAELGDLLAARRAEVDEKLLDLDDALAVLALLHVRRRDADHPEHHAPLARADRHTLGEQDTVVPPAERRKAHEALLVDVVDDQADLVQVGVEHQDPVGPAADHGHQRAERVLAHLVGRRLHQRPDHRARIVLEPGRAKRVRQSTNKLQRLHSLLLRVKAPFLPPHRPPRQPLFPGALRAPPPKQKAGPGARRPGPACLSQQQQTLNRRPPAVLRTYHTFGGCRYHFRKKR